MPKKKVDPTPCECSKYLVEAGDETIDTGCESQSRGAFAPGHDAKLKSLLITAGVKNGQVVKQLADNGTQSMSHLEAAEEHGFTQLVVEAVHRSTEQKAARERRKAEQEQRAAQREQEKAGRKERREQEKAERAERKRMAEEQKSRLPDPGPARALVGRNEHDGEISADGLFHYQVDGESQVAEKYTIVPAA